MKTILIPTYYFKPCNLPPVNRINSWIDYFTSVGYYVIIITRYWNVNLNEYEKINTLKKVEYFTNYEVHYLPYSGNFKTKKINKFVRKFFTFIELCFQNTFLSILSYKNIFDYSLQFINKKRPNFILITGSPFQLFLIGYKAKKNYNINWIADYRDHWTTGFYGNNFAYFNTLIKSINNHYQRKWLKTASAFTTVSNNFKQDIENLIAIKGYTIYNGYTGKIELKENNSKTLHVLYSGEVYILQDYKTLINGIKKIINEYGKEAIKMTFLGTKSGNFKIPNELIKDFEFNFEITERLPYEQALIEQSKADICIMLGHKNLKGMTSSKMFDYLKFVKPIIVLPNDNDILEELCIKSNLGKIANSEDELYNILSDLILEKQKNGYIKVEPNLEYIQQFSREEQAKKLLKIINQYI